MARIVYLHDNKGEMVYSEADFARLIRDYMGWDASQYFEEFLEELEFYRERNKKLEQLLEESMEDDE